MKAIHPSNVVNDWSCACGHGSKCNRLSPRIPLIWVNTPGETHADRYVTASTSGMTSHLLVNGQLYLGNGQMVKGCDMYLGQRAIWQMRLHVSRSNCNMSNEVTCIYVRGQWSWPAYRSTCQMRFHISRSSAVTFNFSNLLASIRTGRFVSGGQYYTHMRANSLN